MSGQIHDLEAGQHVPIIIPHTAATSPNAIERDQDLWFEDGNIVVVAQRTAFRFHRGALSRHSQIFRHLFTVPQPTPSDAVESIDGCTAIHVSDTPSDFKYLLCAVYDGIRCAHAALTNTANQLCWSRSCETSSASGWVKRSRSSLS